MIKDMPEKRSFLDDGYMSRVTNWFLRNYDALALLQAPEGVGEDKCFHTWPNMVRYLDQKCFGCGIKRSDYEGEKQFKSLNEAIDKAALKAHPVPHEDAGGEISVDEIGKRWLQVWEDRHNPHLTHKDLDYFAAFLDWLVKEGYINTRSPQAPEKIDMPAQQWMAVIPDHLERASEQGASYMLTLYGVRQALKAVRALKRYAEMTGDV